MFLILSNLMPIRSEQQRTHLTTSSCPSHLSSASVGLDIHSSPSNTGSSAQLSGRSSVSLLKYAVVAPQLSTSNLAVSEPSADVASAITSFEQRSQPDDDMSESVIPTKNVAPLTMMVPLIVAGRDARNLADFGGLVADNPLVAVPIRENSSYVVP